MWKCLQRRDRSKQCDREAAYEAAWCVTKTVVKATHTPRLRPRLRELAGGRIIPSYYVAAFIKYSSICLTWAANKDTSLAAYDLSSGVHFTAAYSSLRPVASIH